MNTDWVFYINTEYWILFWPQRRLCHLWRLSTPSLPPVLFSNVNHIFKIRYMFMIIYIFTYLFMNKWCIIGTTDITPDTKPLMWVIPNLAWRWWWRWCRLWWWWWRWLWLGNYQYIQMIPTNKTIWANTELQSFNNHHENRLLWEGIQRGEEQLEWRSNSAVEQIPEIYIVEQKCN